MSVQSTHEHLGRNVRCLAALDCTIHSGSQGLLALAFHPLRLDRRRPIELKLWYSRTGSLVVFTASLGAVSADPSLNHPFKI